MGGIGTTPETMERSPADRSAPSRSEFFRAQLLHGRPHLFLQLPECRLVPTPPSPQQNVGLDARDVECRKHIPPTDLAEPPLQEIPLHDLPTVLRNDESQAGTRSGRSSEEDIDIRSPLPLPPLEQLTDFRAESNPRFPREALVSALDRAVYFPPILTTSRARPRLRRRLSVFRPPLVFMRARNPCLFFLLRLRGLYVGFITASPSHVYNVSNGA